jgi:HEAT repeat protein
MRANYLLAGLLICTIILSTNLLASSPDKAKSALSTEFIEDNLLEGLSSDNMGLRISTAYYLGEYKTQKAVIPLIKMLHSEKEEVARIQAALSLIKIGDSKGVFMVKQAAKFDESRRVRNLCGKFYNAYTAKQVN